MTTDPTPKPTIAEVVAALDAAREKSEAFSPSPWSMNRGPERWSVVDANGVAVADIPLYERQFVTALVNEYPALRAAALRAERLEQAIVEARSFLGDMHDESSDCLFHEPPGEGCMACLLQAELAAALTALQGEERGT